MNREMMLDSIDVPPSEDSEEPPGLGGTIVCDIQPSRQTPSLLHDLPILNIKKDSLKLNSFPEGALSKKFREVFFPDVSREQWMSWKWQLKHRVTDHKTLSKFLCLTEEEQRFYESKQTIFPLAITPYYLSLFAFNGFDHPLRRSVVPLEHEYDVSDVELTDPLGEDHDSPVPGIVHRYPDRVLFLSTMYCSTYCRYCTRSRIVSKTMKTDCLSERWEKGIDYIKRTPVIRDVLISGGDPLTLPDETLKMLLTKLRNIPHVEIIRLGSKMPVVLPFRITTSLARMLKQFHPLYMNIHFTHPDELTPETREACRRLADAGIPLGSQTVLLKNINDRVDVMTQLFQGLLTMRVKPYYLFQCDLAPGTTHLRTPVETGLSIIKGLRGFTSGLAIPHYVIDAPRGGGKIPLLPEYLVKKDQCSYVLRNYEDKLYTYPDVGND
ncbi:MAG: KamA family radical SAM protein [Spirochaetales bacterium]|nr:KamA family radical SAM protein [Spirochaetales bacterium]